MVLQHLLDNQSQTHAAFNRIRERLNLSFSKSDLRWTALWLDHDHELPSVGGTGTHAISLAMRLCRQVDVFGFGIASQAPWQNLCYGHYYQDADPKSTTCGSGHALVQSEVQIAVLDALRMLNYVWW